MYLAVDGVIVTAYDKGLVVASECLVQALMHYVRTAGLCASGLVDGTTVLRAVEHAATAYDSCERRVAACTVPPVSEQRSEAAKFHTSSKLVLAGV
jgi:hypothetical protein